MKKKFISWMLSMAVILSMMPAAPAYAEESQETGEPVVTEEEVLPAPEEEVLPAPEDEEPEEPVEPPEEPPVEPPVQETYYHGFSVENGIITGRYSSDNLEIRDMYLLLVLGEEASVEVIDPSGSDSGSLWYFDPDGKGTEVTEDGIYAISYEETKADYHVLDGRIARSDEDTFIVSGGTAYKRYASGKVKKVSSVKYVTYEEVLYKTDRAGTAVKYTGLHDSIYYKAGKIARSGTKVVISSLKYVVKKDGTIKLLTGFDGSRYYVKGKKSAATGIRGGKYVVKGKIRTSSSAYNLIVSSCMYRISKNGSAEKKKKNRSTSYYAYAKTLSGQYYMYKVNPKTAKAVVYKKSRKHTDFYTKLAEGKAYEVFEKTGKARKFTGVYRGKYYRNAKLGTSDAAYYAIYGQYVYKVKKSGSCAKYIKKRFKRGTYIMKVDGRRVSVYYSSGKIKKCLNPSREDFVENAKRYIGIDDRYNDQQRILDLYNSYRPHPRGYRMTTRDPWCATFVSAMAVELGYTDYIKPECSCYYQVREWQRKGRWKEKDSYVPKPGDIIYYDWEASSHGDCKGYPDHVGIVEKVVNGKITVIEGNKMTKPSHVGYVSRRVIPVNYKKIRGFGLPKYTG